MANINLNSYTNSSAIGGLKLGFAVSVDGFVNGSVIPFPTAITTIQVGSIPNVSNFSNVSLNVVTHPSSKINTSSVGSVVLGSRLRPNSLSNSSSVGLISRLPDQIGVNSVVNISSVSGVIIPTNVNTSLLSWSNTSIVPMVMVTGGVIVDNSITPVKRPVKNTSTATTGLKKFVFRDIALKGGSHPLTGDFVTVTDFNAVAQSIRNIVMTNPTERFFDHIDFGVGIEKYLFSIYSNGLQDRIKEDIIAQVALYEPRALILDVILDGEAFKHELSIEIVYKIKTTQVTSSLIILLERR